MNTLSREILEQVIQASAEPLLIVRVDHPDWPVVLAMPRSSRSAAPRSRDNRSRT